MMASNFDKIKANNEIKDGAYALYPVAIASDSPYSTTLQ